MKVRPVAEQKRSYLRTLLSVTLWGVTLLLAAGYLVQASYPKLIGEEGVVAQFEAFGYAQWFRFAIGVVEGLGAVLLLIPRTATWGASLLMLVMVGALYSHLTSGIGSPVHATRNLVLLGLIAFARWKDAYRPGTKA